MWLKGRLPVKRWDSRTRQAAQRDAANRCRARVQQVRGKQNESAGAAELTW